MRFDTVRLGFILGLLAPALGVLGYALMISTSIHPGMGLGHVIKNMLFGIRGNIAPTLSLSLIADVVLFFFFDRKRMLKAMRGVIGAMFAYGAVIVLLILLWGRDFM